MPTSPPAQPAAVPVCLFGLWAPCSRGLVSLPLHSILWLWHKTEPHCRAANHANKTQQGMPAWGYVGKLCWLLRSGSATHTTQHMLFWTSYAAWGLSSVISVIWIPSTPLLFWGRCWTGCKVGAVKPETNLKFWQGEGEADHKDAHTPIAHSYRNPTDTLLVAYRTCGNGGCAGAAFVYQPAPHVVGCANCPRLHPSGIQVFGQTLTLDTLTTIVVGVGSIFGALIGLLSYIASRSTAPGLNSCQAIPEVCSVQCCGPVCLWVLCGCSSVRRALEVSCCLGAHCNFSARPAYQVMHPCAAVHCSPCLLRGRLQLHAHTHTHTQPDSYLDTEHW